MRKKRENECGYVRILKEMKGSLSCVLDARIVIQNKRGGE